VQRFTLTVVKAGTGSGTVTSSPAGISCGATCAAASADYDSGTVVTLSATAAAGGSTFAGWSGGGCSGTRPCTVTMRTATAGAGTGSGTVTWGPAGISCGVSCAADSADYDSGTVVTLAATAAGGSTFAGWSGGVCSGTSPCTVTMSAARSVTATFNIQRFTLTVNPAGAGSGTVTSNDGLISCPGTCLATYDSGSVVTLTATTAGGSACAGWRGSGTGRRTSCPVSKRVARWARA